MTLSPRSKYAIVAHLLRNATGRLLDVGSRDHTLKKWLPTGQFHFTTADVVLPCDYQIDLEQPLPFPNRALDCTVALDVIQHTGHIHMAFAELARITRTHLVVALPNFASLSRRLHFLFAGDFGTDKYDLTSTPQRDPHRWLTTHRHVEQFITASTTCVGFRIEKVVGQVEGASCWSRALNLAQGSIFPSELTSSRTIFLLRRH